MTLSKNEIKHIFQEYALGEVQKTTRITKGYANANFKVETTRGIYLLKVYLAKELHQIEYETQLLERLQKEGFPVAYPILNRSGNYIYKSSLGNGVVFHFLEGNEPRVNLQTVGEIGKAVAQLNSLKDVKTFKRYNLLGWEACKDLALKAATIEGSYQPVAAYFAKQNAVFEEVMDLPFPEGLVHNDVFTDNTIFEGNRFKALIDFEFACVDRLLVDIGTAINGFCFRNNRLDFDLLKVFLEAYQEVRPLSDLEKEWLPNFIHWGVHAMISSHLQIIIKTPNERRHQRIGYFIERAELLKKQWRTLKNCIESEA